MLNREQELRNVAERLIALVLDNAESEPREKPGEGGTLESEPVDDPRLGRIALAIYRARRKRAQMIPPDLLGEPAWDMLLDLVIQRSLGRRVSVTSLTIASGVPSTTALRWIKVLIDHGLVTREESADDRRKVFIDLTDRGYQVMRRFLLSSEPRSEGRKRPFMLAQPFSA